MLKKERKIIYIYKKRLVGESNLEVVHMKLPELQF